MILVDTSVWIDHIASGVPVLAAALEKNEVLVHPFVIGELACGNLRNRERVLRDFHKLPNTLIGKHADVLNLIEHRKLMGKGLSFVDVHLLAATLLTGDARLWTRDRKLHAAAAALRVAYLEHDA